MTDKFKRNRRLPRISETTCQTCEELCREGHQDEVMAATIVYDFGKGSKIILCDEHYARIREAYEPELEEVKETLR